jgi:hypothetical protein
MAKVWRLGGAIVAETGDEFYLVGDLKEPLDFTQFGFATPPVVSGKDNPYVRLTCLADSNVTKSQPFLDMPIEGEALAKKLVSTFVIHRNGSVSERLWRLVTETSEVQSTEAGDVVAARWLSETPSEVWEAVRDSVLRC